MSYNFFPTLRILLILCFCLEAILPAYAGIYIGVQAGATKLNGQHVYTNADVTPNTTGAVEMSGYGLAYGGQIGYLYDLNLKTFLFLEGIAILGSPSLTKPLTITGQTPDGNINIKRKLTYGGVFGAGFRFNPSVGLYVRVGYEHSKYDFTYSNLTFGTSPTFKTSHSRWTLVPGFGIISKLSDHFFMKFEYAYAMKKTMMVNDPGNPVSGAMRGFTYGPNEHRIMVQFNFQV